MLEMNSAVMQTTYGRWPAPDPLSFIFTAPRTHRHRQLVPNAFPIQKSWTQRMALSWRQHLSSGPCACLCSPCSSAPKAPACSARPKVQARFLANNEITNKPIPCRQRQSLVPCTSSSPSPCAAALDSPTEADPGLAPISSQNQSGSETCSCCSVRHPESRSFPEQVRGSSGSLDQRDLTFNQENSSRYQPVASPMAGPLAGPMTDPVAGPLTGSLVIPVRPPDGSIDEQRQEGASISLRCAAPTASRANLPYSTSSTGSSSSSNSGSSSSSKSSSCTTTGSSGAGAEDQLRRTNTASSCGERAGAAAWDKSAAEAAPAGSADRVCAVDQDSIQSGRSGIDRRALIQGLTLALALGASGSGAAAVPNEPAGEKCEQQFQTYLDAPDWSGPGPLQVVHLPRLEHTCSSCFPACIGTSCLVRVDIAYPRGGRALGLSPPYPLAIFSSGFLVASESYRSHAEALASWGYTVILYDRRETVADYLDDDTCVVAIRDLIDWCATDPLLRRIADTRRVFLAGHSRGGKLAALAAAQDERVAALCLIDAVDNTQYAPLGPGFPSALEALKSDLVSKRTSPLPVAVVGSGLGGSCAPTESNYSRFFEAATGPAWEVDIREAGHFSYLDQASPLQQAVCPDGRAEAGTVRRVSQAVMVAWAETMIRRSGADYQAKGLPAYPSACQQPQTPAKLGSKAEGPSLPMLPTWSSQLPQFYEDTLGAKKAIEGSALTSLFSRGRSAQDGAIRPSSSSSSSWIRGGGAAEAAAKVPELRGDGRLLGAGRASVLGSTSSSGGSGSGGVKISLRDIEVQQAAAAARRRVVAAAGGQHAVGAQHDGLPPAIHLLAADAGLQVGLDAMLSRLLRGTNLENAVDVRYKGFSQP